MLLLLMMIRRSGAATKTKHSDQLRSMQSLLPLITLEDTNNVAARSHCSANEMVEREEEETWCDAWMT